jgi:peptidyl-prolyl cis-trans isomerase B (cyclophilin B)
MSDAPPPPAPGEPEPPVPAAATPPPAPAANPYATPAPAAYGAPAPTGQRTNPLAIVALILAFLIPIGGIICGHIALSQIKKTGEGGHGLALAGTILGYVFTAIWLIFAIIWAAFAAVIIGTGGGIGGYNY